MSFKSIAEFLALTGPAAPTMAEKDLIKATQAGEPCWLCDHKSPSRPSAPTDATRIRASLLRLLITGGSKTCGLHERGVTLFGAWIDGPLDLAWCKARGQTMLCFCHFPNRPRLEGARFQLLGLSDSDFPKGLNAGGTHVRDSLFLSRMIAGATVDVRSAKIGGQLVCTGAALDGGKDPNGTQQRAVSAQGVETRESLFLRNIRATGTVDVNSAKIGGQLDFTGATLDGSKDANGTQQEALNSQGVETGDSLFLRALTATGTVAVNGARIGGQLDCTGATLDGGMDADGTQQRALNAQGVETGQSFFLSTLTATGTVDVNGAKIGGQLACNGATLKGGKDAKGAQQMALTAHGVETGQDLFLSALAATGTVAAIGARIGGQLACNGATLDGGKDAKGAQQAALNAQRMRVTEGFFFGDVKKVTGQVNLTAAHVSDLVDEVQSWPLGTGDLILDGFTYDRTDGPTTLTARRDWLQAGSHLEGEFYPQPYTQFARVLRQMGHAGEARKVLMERASLQAQAARDTRKIVPNGDVSVAFRSLWADVRNLGHWFIDWTAFRVAGYGHAPVRSLWCLGLLFLLATALAHFTWEEGSFAPNSDVVLTSPGWADVTARDCFPAETAAPDCLVNPAKAWSDTFTASADTPTQGADWDSFNALGYAADLVVPFLDLGQTDAWAPSKDRGTWGWWLWCMRWVLAAAGWIVTGLGVAAVTGVMQRNQPE